MNTVNETPRSKLRGISPRLTSFVISLLRSKLRGIKPSLGLKVLFISITLLSYVSIILALPPYISFLNSAYP